METECEKQVHDGEQCGIHTYMLYYLASVYHLTRDVKKGRNQSVSRVTESRIKVQAHAVSMLLISPYKLNLKHFTKIFCKPC